MTTTTTTTTDTTCPFEADRLAGIERAKTTLEYALANGWRQTCKRGGKVFIQNAAGVKGWVNLRSGTINANLYFVSRDACA
jgi:hypothetical protein